MFEDNPEEYIRRDIEGSDVDTRRRAACDLVKALSKEFEQITMTSFGLYVKVNSTFYISMLINNLVCIVYENILAQRYFVAWGIIMQKVPFLNKPASLYLYILF